MKNLVWTLLLVSSLGLSQEQRPTEVQPVAEKEDAADSDKSNQEKRETVEESYIRITVGEFERLIEAVRAEKPEQSDYKNSNSIKCNDSTLSYADFVSCKDLEAQEEMARGTTQISGYARTTVVISWWALAFLFFSLVAASVAAYYAKKTADAAERSEGAFVDIELSTDPDKFYGQDLKREPKMTICVFINNYGKTPARNLTYKVTPVTKGNQPIYCEGLVAIFPPTKENTKSRFLKDFASVDTTFDAIGWLMGKGTDFVVEWEYETIFSKKVRIYSYTAKLQADTEGVVDHAMNTTHQNFSTWFERFDESESVRAKTEKNKKES